MTWGHQQGTMLLQGDLTKLSSFKLRLCMVARMLGSSTKDIKPSNRADILSVKIQEPAGSEKICASEVGLNSRAVCLCQL
jgi:hypothetical protein